MNDDEKKAYRDHEARQKDIYDHAHMEVIQKLDARFETIIQQYGELQWDYIRTLDEDEWVLLGELERLRKQMSIAREVVVCRKLLRALYLEKKYYDDDTEINMLLAKIARLEDYCRTSGLEESSNTIDIDRKLLLFLQKSIKKWEKPKTSSSPKTFDLAMEALEYAQKTGLSINNAAGKIADKAGAPRRRGRIGNVISEIKKKESDRLAQAVEDFSPLLINKNDPHE